MEKEQTLQFTSTWAVAVVCFVLLFISIVIEKSIHRIGTWLKKKNKKDLYEALEKVKAELMLLGFISLLLTIGQTPISKICISKHVASTMHPCSAAQAAKMKAAEKEHGGGEKSRLLLDLAESYIPRRSLAAKGDDKCTGQPGKVAFVSAYGIHQLHIFIFVLAVVHVIYCIVTYGLGKSKMRRWKPWEEEAKTVEYQLSNDPARSRFARDTTFGRRHLSFWSKTSITLWIVCFFRQFFGSITKVDYLTLRHGFITAHFAPRNQSIITYDFRKHIQRTLEEDFKTVVEISPVIWFAAVLFLLTNSTGLHSYLWLPFIPLVNAFQLAFFAWSTFEFGLKNCFHESIPNVVIRLVVGAFVQILCSYVTLPLYALVTHMGSQLKPTVFNEEVATALEKWHHTAKDQTKHGKHSESNTPLHESSSSHLLHKVNKQSDFESHPSSHEHDHSWDPESQHQRAETSTHHPPAHESSEKK